ncbi:response regulator transcription factor [Deinococcus hopiensis]|uniref:DNA-binding response regulator, OmpR family, contains REC and winged-helix (WHTH) domain n=1 Tax=Deinococcus hopiensis KR-140 TaxID=695939 RepID=A0A1W1UVY5_9DEIO|nr:response regulator transcription factor [Deinococcus hopiensis]SMB85210.1 DNA-binding response regulator, OmpR family, contains REC and winged-helix (wHTH) domain [Deinococcus hopiensis KR-140]
MPERILLIEDNLDLTALLQYDLQGAGYEVTTAADGRTGMRRAQEQHPDLVLLDLGLPDINGAQVALQLRKTSAVPIVILTAVDTVESKAELLSAGANDYLTKPFFPEELLVRVEAQLRRQPCGKDDTLTVGSLELRPQLRQCLYEEREVQLSPIEFDLLLLLARHPGRLYSVEQLEHELWNGAPLPGRQTLHMQMRNLHTKLRNVKAAGLIRTLRGMGYAFRPNYTE